MNNRGFVFAIMTVFLVLAVIYFNQSYLVSSERLSIPQEGLRLSESSEYYRNASSIFSDFYKTGYDLNSAFRTVPFDYNFPGDNSLLVSFNAPLLERLNESFDFLGLASVFISSSGNSDAFGGAIIDINSPRNAFWGGTDTNLEFIILSHCYSAAVDDSNTFTLSPSSSDKCLSPFSAGAVREVDINVSILSSLSDYSSVTFDSVECSGSCPAEADNPLDLNVFYVIRVDDSSCSSCSLASSQKIISFTAVSGTDHNIILSCTTPGCSSEPLFVRINGPLFSVSYSGSNIINASIKAVFSSEPVGFTLSNSGVLAGGGTASQGST